MLPIRYIVLIGGYMKKQFIYFLASLVWCLLYVVKISLWFPLLVLTFVNEIVRDFMIEIKETKEVL